MDIVRFTAGASAEALAGSTGGDRVVELGAASVAELLAEPAAFWMCRSSRPPRATPGRGGPGRD
jgi:hypothetical protein